MPVNSPRRFVGSAVSRRLRLALPAALAVLAAACSSGSSDGGGAGDLRARVLWEQPEEAAATSGAAPSGGFGPDLPAAVRTVRFDFVPESGPACCVAVDPREIPVDPDIGQRRVILKQLPAGRGQLTIAGFPGDDAPAPSSGATICQIEPSDAALPCQRGLIDTPSFLSAPQSVTVVGPGVTDAGDIEVPALPFVVPGSLEPMPDADVVSPARVRAHIAIAAGAVREDSIAVAISPLGDLAVAAVPCDDFGANPCSPDGELEVSGFAIESAAADVPLGITDVSIDAQSVAGGAALQLSYDISVVSAVTPTNTPTATVPTPTRSATAVPTATPTAEASVTRRPPSATPTRTDTPEATPTGPTASPTATPNAMCSAQPRQGCRRSVEAGQSLLVLERAGGGSNDSLLFRWENGDFTQVRDFGDPGLSTSYAICLYDEVGNVPVLRRQWFVPPGPDCPSTGCWRPTEDGFRYTDPAAARDGIDVIDLNAGLPGKASILVTGSGPNLDIPALPLTQNQSVIVQVLNDFGSGQCWEESFRLPALRNTDQVFRDRGDGPAT